MIEYQLTKQGEFSNEDFVSIINKAFEKISKKYNLEKEDFKQIRASGACLLYAICLGHK